MSEPGESEAAFREPAASAAADRREQAVEMEKVKFEPKFEALDMELPTSEAPEIGRFVAGSIFADAAGDASRTTRDGREAAQADDRLHVQDRRRSRRNGSASARRRRPIQVKPRKADVHVTHFGLGWAPYWRTERKATPAYR